ncbi:MAG: polysaccharide lyase 8 family protein, partial [Epulopiscium sp.]|nr:polysaccharide lyase 8 family protein [Candidatus Epulonipiscium sp.]
VNQAEKDEFDLMREQWAEKILGTPYDQNDEKVKEIVENAVTRATIHWETMNKDADRTYLWEILRNTDKELPPAKANSAHPRSMYLNLMDMTRAYKLPGSSLYGNQELVTDIIEALDWLWENHYYAGKAPYSNWWNWEIGIPVSLNDIVVLLYDELSPIQIKNYMDAIEYFQPDPTKSGVNGIGTTSPNLREAVGANRVDVSKVVAIRGVIVKDGEKIAASRDALSQVFEYVEIRDGFYKDGSFIQHETIPYTGSYGDVLINGVASLLEFLHGTSWEVTDPKVENIYKAVIDSFEPLLYKGAIMDMVSGRAISRPVGDHGRGRGILNAIINLIPSAPPQYAARYQSLVKSMILDDSFQPYFEYIGNMQLYNAAKEIVNDPQILKRESYVKHIQFPSMDRVVHHQPNYAFGIASHSKRVGNYEAMNNENTKGWYTGDGMTYLYNEDLGHYTDYWPLVDPYRIPGTTEDTELRQDNSGQRRSLTREKGMSSKSWVGGTSLAQKYGTWGMDFESWDESLEAKKSWFMFDKEIVALGAGITSEKQNVSVETTIENRKLNQKGTNRIRVGNGEIEKEIAGQEIINQATWAHMEGSIPGSDIGYYFPRTQEAHALYEVREGKYTDINYGGSADLMTNAFFTLWIDHGQQPDDAKYEYVLLPNQTVEETKQYAKDPEIIILSNTEEAQGVKNTRLNVVGINFWTDTMQKVDKVTSYHKAAVMVQEEDGTIEIAVSDPTMENTGVIQLELDQIAYEVLSKDARITVQQLQPTIKISVDVQDAKGQ